MSDVIPGGPPAEPVEPVAPVDAAPEYVPPTGDEPWAKYLENVPEVLLPDIVTGYREMERNSNARIEKLTPYEPLAERGIAPDAAAMAVDFAETLYGRVDPTDPVAVALSKEQRLTFYRNYQNVLKEAGILDPDPAEAAAAATEAARIAAEREFETPEQKDLREAREKLAALEARQGTLEQQRTDEQAERQRQSTQATLKDAYKADWETAIATHGQVSKREFEVISVFANADEDDSPGVIQRAYAKMLTTVGRLADLDPAAGNPQPKPPVVIPSAGGAVIPTPDAPNLRFDDPGGRAARRKLAREAMDLIIKEGADAV